MSIPPAVLTVDELNEFLSGAFPVARTYRVAEVTDRGITARLAVGPEHGRPGGTVSGPTMMGLVDGAAWLATLSRIGIVPLAVTSNLTISFLAKPALDADLVADTELLRLAPRSSVCAVRVESAGTVVAHATVAYSIPA